ncbi:MAG: carbonic anhydrase [Gammaproteobacteria bacterium]
MSIDALIDGYRRFRANRFEQARALYERLASAQRPRALMVGCCDSRVDPATITDTGPGELFVVRNVANLIPPYTPDGRHHGTSAALEFGVLVLGIPDIVVLGHARCGGAQALLAGAHDSAPMVDFVGAWMGLAADARERVLSRATPGADLQRELELEIVRLSIDNLHSFPWIAERVADGRLRIHGWHFGIANGELAVLDRASDEFSVLA